MTLGDRCASGLPRAAGTALYWTRRAAGRSPAVLDHTRPRRADGIARAAVPRASCPAVRRARARHPGRSPRSSGETGRTLRSGARRASCTAAAPPGARVLADRERNPVRDQALGRRSSCRRNSASKALRLASSNARFGMTTTSNPGAILLRLNTSRIKRLARFLETAPPNFRVAAMPRRPTWRPLRSRKNVPNRPWTFVPRS